MGAAPGTGPNTGAIPAVKRVQSLPSVADLPADRTLVMGILNVTPDSFSDGGQFYSPDSAAHETAIHAGLRMHYAGADIIDVGGESTRPGAEPTAPDEEQRRILPVIEALFKAGAVVSVDTRHASTARAAIELAPTPQSLIINDVSGLLTEEDMPELVAESGTPVILMHNRGDSKTMQQRTDYGEVASPQVMDRLAELGVDTEQFVGLPGVVVEVIDELLSVRQRYLDAGVPPEKIILDPGIGFAKTFDQSWVLLRHLGSFTALGHKVLLGASRKGFLGELLSQNGTPRPAQGRDAATAALSTHAAAQGVWAVRVHEVESSLDAVRVVARLGS